MDVADSKSKDEPRPSKEVKKIRESKPPSPNDKKKGIDPDDPSVVYDEPYQMVTGFRVFNGQAYDKACLWVEPNTKLVLEEGAIEIERHDDPNVLVVFMEKRVYHYVHEESSRWPIPDSRRRMGCVAKLENGEVWIGTLAGIPSLKVAALSE